MGTWGAGLYSSDFALDLRGSVKAVARLPFAPDRLLDTLCAMNRSSADDPKDEDHSVFWLTVADQLAKRGVDCARARDRALAIIADRSDLAMMASLGMDEKDLAKRGAALDALRLRLSEPVDTTKRRKVLKAPQKLLLEVGELVSYPICKGQPINPYTVGKDFPSVKAWKRDGWAALVIVERGHVLDFLAWYRPVAVLKPLLTEPTRADLLAPRTWEMKLPGTLTARHAVNMGFTSLGHVRIDAAALARRFASERRSPRSCAISDISLANYIHVGRDELFEASRARRGLPTLPYIDALAEIADVT